MEFAKDNPNTDCTRIIQNAFKLSPNQDDLPEDKQMKLRNQITFVEFVITHQLALDKNFGLLDASDLKKLIQKK